VAPLQIAARLGFFGSTAQGQGDIYTAKLDGTSLRKLTQSPGFRDEPAWSPDGQRIAYTKQTESGPELWIMDADGSSQHPVAPGHWLRSADWSPNGKTLIAVEEPSPGQGGALVLVAASTGAITKLADTPGTAGSPDWSPDGRLIAFTLFPTNGNDEDVYVVKADGSEPRPLATGPGYEYAPDWSPDGKHLLFVREADVWNAASDGTGQRRLTTGLRADSPTWSPDGAVIAFAVAERRLTMEEEPTVAVWVMKADGSLVQRLPLEFDSANPAWVPSGM
jgi:TolB protein